MQSLKSSDITMTYPDGTELLFRDCELVAEMQEFDAMVHKNDEVLITSMNVQVNGTVSVDLTREGIIWVIMYFEGFDRRTAERMVTFMEMR